MKFKLSYLLDGTAIITFIAFLLILHVLIKDTGDSIIRSKSNLDDFEIEVYVKNIANGIDPSVDPCDDFYQFTCGLFMNSKNWPRELSGKIEKQLISSLERDIDVNETEPENFVKYFYKTCVNESVIDEQVGLAPFLNIMEQIGGWPVLKENGTWNETAFNWNRIIFKIGNASYWHNIFVPITLYLNSTNLTQFNIVLEELTYRIPENVLTGGINNNEVQKYFKYMVDIAVSMGASKSYATKELNETLHFEDKLMKITFASRKESDPNYTNSLDKRITTSELMKNYSFIPWDEYIKCQLPSNVTLNDIDNKILVHNLNYINDLKDLIETTPKRVVANYIMWRNFDSFADYLHKNIRDIKMNYENARNANTINESRSKQCYGLISATMPLVLNMIYVREYFDKNTVGNVSIISNNVHDEFVELLKNANWMDEGTRNRSIDKAMSLNRIIGYPKELLDDSMTNKYLQDLQFINGNYVANVFNSIIFSKKFLWKLVDSITVNEMNRWVMFGIFTLTPNAFYVPDNNVLFVPAGYLQNPIYSYDFPMYINYGKLGFTLGHEIAHGFDAQNHEFDKFKNIVDWPNETDTIYSDNAKCILEQYSNYSGVLTAEESHNENIADNSGIKVAYYAYKKISNMDKSETIKGKVYTSQQMFWISAANMWCKMPGEDSVHSSPRNRVIGPFSNMKEFADDFNCPKDSKMNPSKKCQVW